MLGWAAIAMLSAYALFVGGAWLPTYDASFRAASLILAAGGIAMWLAVAVVNPFWRPRTTLAPAFAAALAAFVIGTLASRQPRLGAEYLAWSILLAALYLLLQRLMASPFFRPRMVGFATVAGVVIGVVFLGAIVARWIPWWDTIGRLTAPPLRPGFEGLVYGNPSAVMTASLLLAGPAIAVLWGGSRLRSLLAGAIAALASTVTLLSGSRAGWLALAITVGLVGSILLLAPDRRKAIVAGLGSRTARLVGIPAVLAVLAIGVVVGPGLFARVLSGGGETARVGFYVASLRMFESSPLTGTGPGTWAPLRIANTAPGELDYYIPHAHDVYLQTLAEFGVVGLVAGLVVVVALVRLIRDALRDAEPLRRRMGWATLFVSVYFGTHQLLDFYPNAPAIMFVFAIPIAWLDATASNVRPSRRRVAAAGDRLKLPRQAFAIAGSAAVIGAVVFLAWSEGAALRMDAGVTALNRGDPSSAVGPLTEAVARDPAMPAYHFALGLALANTGDLAGAEPEFLASANADGLPEAWLDLAAVRALRGDRTGAADALDRARRFGDQQPAVAIAAGAVALDIGDRGAAVSAFSEALLRAPSLAGDEWWNADRERSSAAREAFQIAFQGSAPLGQFELALETGDTATARRILDELPDTSTAGVYRLILAAWNGDATATAELAQVARADPFDVTVVNWCARLARRDGDLESADVYLAWAKTVGSTSEAGGFEIRVTQGLPERIAGINSLYYGHYTYRRPTPWMQLIDGLPHLGYE